MKNLLLYNYNIDILNYNSFKDGISFYIDYNKYYFVKIHRTSNDIDEIYKILINYINSYHTIIPNKFGEVVSKNNKNYYVLLKIKGSENNEIEIIDIINNHIKLSDVKSNLRRDNWGVLWSGKVDYLEYQVSELGSNHPIVISSFSYYVGLAENAIEYFNLINNKNETLVVSQKRIYYPNTSLNFFNPLNIVIDYSVRDIAEYLKSCFFENNDAIKALEIVVRKNTLTNNEYNLLYARLLYPSYYFDLISSILEDNEDETILIKYIEKINDYEEFLRECYFMLSKKCNMIKVDWIINSAK